MSNDLVEWKPRLPPGWVVTHLTMSRAIASNPNWRVADVQTMEVEFHHASGIDVDMVFHSAPDTDRLWNLLNQLSVGNEGAEYVNVYRRGP